MAIPAKQIGWSQKANLLWDISKQLETLTKVAGNVIVTPQITGGWSVVTGGAAGDGTVAQYADNGFNIAGPDDDQDNGWVYIKQYFPNGAIINMDYQWAGTDESLIVDRPIYCIDDVEPTGVPSNLDAQVNATPQQGTWNITVNPGQWFSVGIYSSDSCCGRGFLSVFANIETLPFWTFQPDVNLEWPTSQTGYTLYTGGWSNYDDGQATDPIDYAGTFSTDGVGDTQFYLSTNGYIFGVINNYNLEGNQQDLYLTPGDSLSDGDIQNFWYQNTSDSNKWKTSILIYCGHCCGPEPQATPYSYILNLYKDANYQYLEARVKTDQSNNGYCGPNNDVRQSTTVSQVWQSDVDGLTWTYLGTGSMI